MERYNHLVELASDSHMVERVNITSGSPPSVLLSTEAVNPTYLHDLDGVCYRKGNQKKECTLSPVECYQKYTEESLKYTLQHYDYSDLPGNSPVLAHIIASIQNQPKLEAGGSFLPFLKSTLDKVCNINQQGTVKTIIFGKSSAELKAMKADIHKEYSKMINPVLGSAPTSFLTFSISYIYGNSEESFQLTNLSKNAYLKMKDNCAPARISLGMLNKRWDIVFDWQKIRGYNDFTGDYSIKYSSINDDWIKFFFNIPGIVVGVNLEKDYTKLIFLLTSCFKFQSSRQLQVKASPLSTMMHLVGANFIDQSLQSLAYCFLGLLLITPEKFERGFGEYHLKQLPSHLNEYIQLHVNALSGIVTVLQLINLLHAFPTPGIAALVSRKCPRKFLVWHARFFSTLCSSIRLKEGYTLENPSFEVQGQDAHFSIGDVNRITPFWSNITYGGCWNDSLAVRFALQRYFPLLSSNDIPIYLKWECDPDWILRAYKNTSFETLPKELLGCRSDGALAYVPNLCDPLQKCYLSLISLCRKHEEEVTDLSAFEILFLHTWQHPELCINLYKMTVAGKSTKFPRLPRMYRNNDLKILLPILIAYSGEDLRIPSVLGRSSKRKSAPKSPLVLLKGVGIANSLDCDTSSDSDRVVLSEVMEDDSVANSYLNTSQDTLVMNTPQLSAEDLMKSKHF